ncbi:YeaC family protein [Alkalimarinus alittae]|uniref:YeaC family protein n=1 Tax=Alkalimarinus alittae TaxID=2961619 RepID=A0ABY6N5Q4_9ALTE|nr:YeaC family protein [Alkalimarinus alittae]UZE97452.1 YeaC family protein [Alkalimarinus alittae]
MTFEEIVQKIDPQIYKNLRTALELGKWPDGRVLTRDQKEISMQAVIYYENQANIAESDRIGFIDRAKVEATPCATSAGTNDVEVIKVG